MIHGVGTALLHIASGCGTSETTDEETVTTAEKARAFVGDITAGEFNRAHNQLNDTDKDIKNRMEIGYSSITPGVWSRGPPKEKQNCSHFF